ncbi:hypothetical protein [Clostridium sp.]|uniref:hypothetical protein n=1 Tax=Clostridium sp. TaxID=1506 RepID=UPI00284F2920|nr:hypothetical protein [Clostridium sp.]MDR3597074.1 hypothetical protein [Clostridium sp.]
MLNPAITQKEKVNILASIGCKVWSKNGMNRIYINEDELRLILGSEANYYSSNSLRNCKYYYDITSDSFGYKHYEGCTDLHESIFRMIDEFIAEKYNGLNKAKAAAEAEREVTIDEINEALGF